MNENENSHSFVSFSILSGTFAALASVFAKLFTDARTFLITQYLCNAIGNEIINCEEFLNEIEKVDKNDINWVNA
jgi:hypothetical protein